MSLAITVLEMPTMSIVESFEPLMAMNWTDARPWIAMLGAVILFLGWELRKKQREIQKLDLEIAQMRSQQCLVRVATIHEMNSLIKDVEEISARKLGILGGTKESARTFVLEGTQLRQMSVIGVSFLEFRPQRVSEDVHRECDSWRVAHLPRYISVCRESRLDHRFPRLPLFKKS